MPDMLAKAAEAVREWVRNRFCRPCVFGRGEHDPCADCPLLRFEGNASDLARAVLEAAGYEEAIALVEELRQWVYSDCASIVLYGPEDCQHCAYRKACKLPGLAERIQAALARAGKEA